MIPRPPRRRVGTGYVYTDLERLRLLWLVENTRMSVREMAKMIERPCPGVRRYLYRAGIWVSEVRGGERPWSGV